MIVYGALMSADPGDIHETIDALIRDRIRVSVVGLAAQVAICNELCARTNGGSDSDGGDGHYSVALHEQHFRELMLAVTTPPATRANDRQNHASLLMMRFPSRVLAGTGTGTGTGTATDAGNGSGTGGGSSSDTIHYCACHHRPTREGYACTRCGARVCRLPAVYLLDTEAVHRREVDGSAGRDDGRPRDAVVEVEF